MTKDHLETTYGVDPEMYTRAVEVIENSLLANTGQKVRSIEVKHQNGIVKVWERPKEPIIEHEKGETPSDNLEVDKWCGYVVCVCCGFFLGLIWAAVLWKLMGE